MSPASSLSSSRGTAWPASAEAFSALASVSIRFSSADTTCPLAAIGDFVDLGCQRTDVLGDLGQSVVGCDMRDDAAQAINRCFELLHCRGILPGEDHVDLLRQRAYRLIEADEILGGRQAVQRLANLGKAALESGQRGRIEAVVA